MKSKTPLFDNFLDEYFKELELDEAGGQWRICRLSGEKFYVRPEDVKFYKRMRVPLPTLSPAERMRRKLAYAPGYDFSRVKSARTGKFIVTVYPSATPFKIYEAKLWFSREWDPLECGIVPETDNAFFDQFKKLQYAVPRPNLAVGPSSVNSDYTNNCRNVKNCYFTFDSIRGENLYYFGCCENNRDCVDCWGLNNSDTCYDCSGCMRIWKCFFCERTYDTTESYFLYDCKNCEHCFMSANLRNKKYVFLNRQLTKDEYEKQLKEINLGNYDALQEYLRRFRKMKESAVRKENHNERAFSSVGDWITDSRGCYYVIFTMGSELTAYSLGFYRGRDSYDIVGGTDMERCYEFMSISAKNNYEVKFSASVDNSRNVEYCDMLRNCRNCFGCIGLSDKAFCVFNKQYSEDEYWKLVDGIKTAMLRRGEYGEFFPPQLSPFPYNFSVAMAFPGYKDAETAKRYGYVFETAAEEFGEAAGAEIVPSGQLPPDIKDVNDSILGKVILDEANNRMFRLTEYELEFYRKHNIPLPRIHPAARLQRWREEDGVNLRMRFYERPCAKCMKTMFTVYAPDGPEKNVYCEECYKQNVG